ncbi:hypothetical protein ACQ4PT_054780 [Festuca glaucescens]
MKPPRKLKDIQRLTGCLAALGRFIAHLVPRSWWRRGPASLCYCTWRPHCARQVRSWWRNGKGHPSRRRHPSPSPTPGPLEEGTSPDSVLEVLQGDLAETAPPDGFDGPTGEPTLAEALEPSPEETSASRFVQHPVYFVSTVLRDAHERYTQQQKLLYTLLIASRKLRPYFQAHPIRVVTKYPLETVLRNPNAMGRVAEWAIELQPFELTFDTTPTKKSRALAEFTAEWTDASPDDGEAEEETQQPAILTSPTGDKLRYAVQLRFKDTDKCSNNIVEYKGLLASLRAAVALGVKRLIVQGDSQLLFHFSNKVYKPKDDHMIAYFEEVRRMEKHFLGLGLTFAHRGDNKEADEIARQASRGEAQRPGWIDEIWDYLKGGLPPENDDGAAESLVRRAKNYCLIDGELYCRRPNGVALRCIPLEEGKKLIDDIHAGECCHHSSARTLAGKAFRSGFYWPTALDDAIEIVKSCEACQFHAKQIHQPAQGLHTIPLSWPFAVWGLDILGPFPRALGGYRFLFVTVDKFTKWVEVKAVRTIPARSAVKFIKGLVCRFGVPNRIITDNGSQFTSGLFKSYCADIGTKICYASVAHPRSNGQAERANAEVLKGLKTRSFRKKLKACGKGWLDALEGVLWSIRTMATKPTGETPFFLVYGAEAVIPVELKHGSPRVLAFNETQQDELRQDDLTLLEEARHRVVVRVARYQQALRRYHSRNIRVRTLEVGDLVLRRVLSREGLHKLSAMWDGPFRVAHVSQPGAVHLENEDGDALPNAWNIQHLRKFYP